MSLADEKRFCFFASSDNNVLATNEVDIIIDSECTNYMLKDCKLFATLDESFSRSVGSANNSESEIIVKGRVEFYLFEDNGKRAKITLSEALFVPNFGKNVISVSKLKNFGNKVEFGDIDQILTRDGTVFLLMQENNLFRWIAKFINHETQQNDFCRGQCLVFSNLKLWHDRLGHNNFRDSIKLQNHVDGMQFDKNDSNEVKCDTCELNKAKCKPIPKDSVDRARNAPDFVHVDNLGPVTPVSVDNHRYAISFVDSFSRYLKAFLMKTRDECLQYFQQFCADLGTPVTLVSDGGKVFSSG